MTQKIPARLRRALRITAAIGLAACTLQAPAHEAGEPGPEPGFRPESPYASAFVESFGTATIAVYPTMIRRSGRTAHSFQSQAEVIAILTQDGVPTIRASKRIDLGSLVGGSQWEVAQAGLERVADAISGGLGEAQYHLVLEFLLPVSDGEIFGIECYVLDQQGNNAMSFLLNSHHRIFADARLRAKNNSETARAEMHTKATAVAIEALRAQIRKESENEDRIAAFSEGDYEEKVFDDFEAEVPVLEDGQGIPLGFITFVGDDSSVDAAITEDYPPRPGVSGPNRVLRLDMDVQQWAGFAHFFFYQGPEAAHWTHYDWRGYEGVSFWLYGHNRGTRFFVDLIDNRNPGSTTDDAERYVYMFDDDFSGWRRVAIAFAAFNRKETGNRAPSDGLTLSSVHGWGIGTTATSGPVTYFVDEFSLLYVASESGPVAEAGDVAAYPINELPMYGLQEKTAAQKRADEEYIRTMTRDGVSREEAAEGVAQGAWNTFYSGDKATAIRRFNQAWLLDPDNQLALWGFAVTSIDRGQWEAAAGYYSMAIESGPENPRLQRDYAMALRQIEKISSATAGTPAP